MVGGLLKWIGKGQRDTYLTRSAVVARTALYMKKAGYALGAIGTWNGTGPRPTTTRGVILVIGGVSSIDQEALRTDEYMSDEEGPLQFPNPSFTSHYRLSTFGAMLINTLQAKPEDPSEVFQEYLHSIHDDISSKVNLAWKIMSDESDAADVDKEMRAIPSWKLQTGSSRASPTALRLSAIYFTEVAAKLAPCYEQIATADIIDVASAQRDRDGRTIDLNPALIKFRAIAASIILSVVAKVAGPGFETLHHATNMSLHKPAALRTTCTEVDKLLKHGLSFSRVATLIAFLNCGTNPPRRPEAMQDQEAYYEDVDTIGWRNGSHAVLPALLFSMGSGPSPEVLGFQCADKFIGNIPVYPDGSVKSNKHGRLINSFSNLEPLKSILQQNEDGNTETQIVQAHHKVSLGEACEKNVADGLRCSASSE